MRVIRGKYEVFSSVTDTKNSSHLIVQPVIITTNSAGGIQSEVKQTRGWEMAA